MVIRSFPPREVHIISKIEAFFAASNSSAHPRDRISITRIFEWRDLQYRTILLRHFHVYMVCGDTCANLPFGFDSERLELFMTEDEFNKVFGMDRRDKFAGLPKWRQTEVKRKTGMF
jgi:hypothetical protein